VPRGYIDPKEYDEGITAGILNYSVNASQSHARQHGKADNSSQFINLRPGFNTGAWRVITAPGTTIRTAVRTTAS
jgi:outer membrane usher protein